MRAMCNHDPAYIRENERMGGVGCPLCARERMRERRRQPAPLVVSEDTIEAIPFDGGLAAWMRQEA